VACRHRLPLARAGKPAGLASASRIAYPAAKPTTRSGLHAEQQGSSRPEPHTSPLSGSAEIEAMVARTAPAVLELLRDGAPRARSVIITALADRHPKEDVVRTLMRLTVTEKLIEANRKYSLAPAPETAAERGSS
jgi:hypothetical protein